MAIINGRRLYNSRKLVAVAEIEDRAVSEYAWMMAGVSDDWGRFRANPRTILGEAYKDRPGVTESDIERWLGLFNSVLLAGEEHGLLRLYYVDGVRFAEWTNYMGDPPSQREHHNCPEPEWSTHKHSKACKMWGEARKKPSPRGTRPVSSRGTSSPTPNGHSSDPPVPAVPPVPPETEQADTRTREPNPLVDRSKLVAEGMGLIPQIASLENLDPSEVLNKASEWKGRGYVRIDTMPDDRLAHTVVALRRWHRSLTGEAEPELPAARAAPPKVTPLTERTVDAVREIREREEARRDRAGGVRDRNGRVELAAAAPGGRADDRRLLRGPADGDGLG
jgi:hypothetical protein